MERRTLPPTAGNADGSEAPLPVLDMTTVCDRGVTSGRVSPQDPQARSVITTDDPGTRPRRSGSPSAVSMATV